MNLIEPDYIKKTIFYSAISGAIFGVVSLIPVFMPIITLFIVPFAGCFIPLGFLVSKEGYIPLENKNNAIIGAISGLFLYISFALVFCPMVLIIHFINKNYYSYGINYLNFFLFLMFSFMIIIVYASTNSAAALIGGIVYKYFKGKYND